MQGRLHRAALALANKGIPVFPCITRGKTPATAHGVLDATVDPSAVDRWWRTTDYNIGVATGAVSGVFVVDVDGADAEAELRKLEAANGALPSTVESITANGRHIWFKYSAAVSNSVSKVAPGIDVRGDNGYVLAPPSVHPSGKRYAWSVDTGDKIVAAPAWLIAKVVATADAAANGAAPPSEWHRLVVDGVAEGARNDTVARLTGHLLRRYVDAHVTLELVRAWNAVRCRPPLADKEVVAIVNSIAGKELKRRQEADHGR
jgi:Bifunctional DNA primase/polymerase, N-terminal/Primase C terminal 1 (PriCT-1)